MVAGTVAGMVVGSLPGLTATMAVALLVPFTYTMSPVAGLVSLGAIYMGCIYGGCFSAILINTPGTPSSIGTTFAWLSTGQTGAGRGSDCQCHCRLGVRRSGRSFGADLPESAAGKNCPQLRSGRNISGLVFRSDDYLQLGGRFLFKGITGAAFGVLISTIGIAPIGGDVRFTFGSTSMQGGFNLIVILIGLFCVPELLSMVFKGVKNHKAIEYRRRSGVLMETTRKISLSL